MLYLAFPTGHSNTACRSTDSFPACEVHTIQSEYPIEGWAQKWQRSGNAAETLFRNNAPTNSS